MDNDEGCENNNEIDSSGGEMGEVMFGKKRFEIFEKRESCDGKNNEW